MWPLTVVIRTRRARDFFKFASTDFLDTANLLDACADGGFEHFINTGTSSEYGIKEAGWLKTMSLSLSILIELRKQQPHHSARHLTEGEVFNVGSGIQHNLRTVVDLITTFTNCKKQAKWGMRAGRQHDTEDIWEADIEKIKKDTGWIPRTPLQEGIVKTTNWFKNCENKELSNPRTQI